MKISEFCKSIREATGLNVLAFSKSLGCSHSYVLKVESGAYDDNPSSLVVAKIIMKYDLDIEFFENIDNISFTNEFIEDVKRHLNKNIGTKIVLNKKSIIEKLRKKCLFDIGYKDIDSSMMTGNFLFNQAKYHGFVETDDTFISVEHSVKNEKATIYSNKLDYVCMRNNRVLFVKVVDIRSTIAVNVDKREIYNYVMKLLGEISYGYFETKDNYHGFDVLLVTPSEKIYDYLNDFVLTKKYDSLNNVRYGIALVRPKRPMVIPTWLKNDTLDND